MVTHLLTILDPFSLGMSQFNCVVRPHLFLFSFPVLRTNHRTQALTQVSLEMVLMDLLAVYGQWLEITLER